jgi:hypothetical protein
MRLVERIKFEVTEKDIERSKELKAQYDELLKTGLPAVKAKENELKEEVWVCYEAFRKAQILQSDDIKEKEQALTKAQHNLKLPREEFIKKTELIATELRSLTLPVRKEIARVLQKEMSELLSGSLTRKNAEIADQWQEGERIFTKTLHESNKDAIEEACEMLRKETQNWRSDGKLESLDNILRAIEQFEKSYTKAEKRFETLKKEEDVTSKLIRRYNNE